MPCIVKLSGRLATERLFTRSTASFRCRLREVSDTILGCAGLAGPAGGPPKVTLFSAFSIPEWPEFRKEAREETEPVESCRLGDRPARSLLERFERSSSGSGGLGVVDRAAALLPKPALSSPMYTPARSLSRAGTSAGRPCKAERSQGHQRFHTLSLHPFRLRGHASASTREDDPQGSQL
jgi:hypothetical protein